MKIIACVDNNLGLMFNHRRQSQDRIVREKMKTITNHLIMNAYSYQLYKDVFDHAIVKESFDKDDEYCLIENVSIEKYLQDIDEIILFYWNRNYPADFYLTIDLAQYQCIYEEDFIGSSHEKITLRKYKK